MPIMQASIFASKFAWFLGFPKKYISNYIFEKGNKIKKQIPLIKFLANNCNEIL